MLCYLCSSSRHIRRPGVVRDAPQIRVLECCNCGLVELDQTDHIGDDFYQNSRMHGDEPLSMEAWLNECNRDDTRRFKMLEGMLPNKRLLDFGCGAGGFLKQAKSLAKDAVGVEVETRVLNYWEKEITIVPNLLSLEGKFDLVTSFHVFEHLRDPKSELKKLAKLLVPGGRLIIEVPNSDDILLNLYECEAFQNFTYWSQHLFCFNEKTIETLGKLADLKVLSVQHYQRYPLSNHVFWLSRGMPGGHSHWSFMDSPELQTAYANKLAALGKTDTIIAHFECSD